MDFNYTAEQLAFRDEVRTFVRDHMPHEIARKVIEHKELLKEDWVTWQRILF